MSYLQGGLSFSTLRSALDKRSTHPKYSKCETWTPSQWLQAMIGEIGEVCEVLKKIDRGDYSQQEYQHLIDEELADVQAYLDRWAKSLGCEDLGAATQLKFNAVSKRIGSRVYIGHDNDWHLKTEKKETKQILIPSRDDHAGSHQNTRTVKVLWQCPRCGGPRGRVELAPSYDGSRKMMVSFWTNPCGHIDTYARVRQEAAANKMNSRK